jgi:hypothetical protein
MQAKGRVGLRLRNTACGLSDLFRSIFFNARRHVMSMCQLQYQVPVQVTYSTNLLDNKPQCTL